MTASSIGVAIISYNTEALLRQCLQSAVADASGPMLVVDNRSTDGSAELVRQDFPGVRLVVEDTNRGYGAAANRAVAELATPYVLLLNADTQVAPGTARALAAYFELHPRAAILGPRLVNPRGIYEPSAHRFPKPLALLAQESGLRRWLNRNRRDEWRPRTVEWVLGAALAVRREAFDEIRGFDEGYFLYQEEVDLCHRLRAAGWEIHYTSVATVVHVGGASTSQRAAETFGQFVRSTQRFARLRLSRAGLAGVRATLALVLTARLVRDAAKLVWIRDTDRRQRLQRQTASWLRGLAVLREGD